MLANDPLEAAENAQSFEERGELDKYLVEVVIPGLLLAQIDKDRKVLSQEREVSVVNAYAELLEEVWPESPTAGDAAAPPVLLVSAHGALNFAGALSVSALLRLKNVPHRLLPPDAVQPGRFPDDLAAGAAIVCVCYLKAPSAAKYAYLERRIVSRLPEAKLIGLAWKDSEGARTMINPLHALALLPGGSAPQDTEAQNQIEQSAASV
jgi:hypothetical protein